MDSCKCRKAITAAFEETALALGGVVAAYPVPDEAIWELAQALDVIHGRVCERCGGQGAAEFTGLGQIQHPAIVHLLAQLRGQPATGRTARAS